jgi:hypothetical protein
MADLAEVVRDRFVCPGEVICVIANSPEEGPDAGTASVSGRRVVTIRWSNAAALC